MTINHAKVLGIGAAALIWTAAGSIEAQTIPSNVAQPLNAAANILTGGRVGAPAYAPYGYAPGYGWIAPQPAYPAYAPAQPAYPTTYYQSGYRGYVQPGTTYSYRQQPPWGNPVNRAVNAARSIVQPGRYAYPTYSAPGYAPTHTYIVPR